MTMEIAVLVIGVLLVLWMTGLLKAASREVEVLTDARKADHVETYNKMNVKITDEKVKGMKKAKRKLATLDEDLDEE
jgi:hypothetical protein